MFLIVRKIYLFLYRIHVKLLWVIFPEVLMEYFDISGWHDGSDKIEVWLDEKNYLERSDYKSGTVISHGFTDEKVI